MKIAVFSYPFIPLVLVSGLVLLICLIAVSYTHLIHSKKAILLTLISLPLRNAGKPGVCTLSLIHI